MATVSSKGKCAICGKERSAVICGGCKQIFCYTHFPQHRQQLGEQLDEIEMNRDLFRQTLNEQIKHPQQLVLIKQIDQWENESVQKIQQTAKHCKQMVVEHTNKHFHNTDAKLSQLTDDIRQIRQEDDFNETDLNQLKQKLVKLTTELEQPPNITIEKDSSSFIKKISIVISSTSTRGKQGKNPSSSRRAKDGSLTLAELLDRKQPYVELSRLDLYELDIDDNDEIRRIQGSLVGLTVGDALGASVEFRPNAYLREHPVTDIQGGGTWGLQAGQWTNDTSMALCLAASLIIKKGFNGYDQFVRYKRWYRDGYMSSTDKCFDIGKSTRDAILKFETLYEKTRRKLISNKHDSKADYFEATLESQMTTNGGLQLGEADSAGNGPLMRLAPIPCFYFDSYDEIQKCIDEATLLTHGDPRAVDACRFYACLIWHALNGTSKRDLLKPDFYKQKTRKSLHPEIAEIAEGSYKKKRNGYDDGVRGKGYIVNALEAALWAFYYDDDDFKKGILQAVNLGDDTDTVAAIYGELAGAMYDIDSIPKDWIKKLYQADFIKVVANGLYITRSCSNNFD